MSNIRPAACAGSFYPADPQVLDRMLGDFLADVAVPADEPAPKAIIAPHAGYIYSGSVAAQAYARLHSARGQIRRVVLIGPSHRVGFQGIALTQADTLATPLGEVPVDRQAYQLLTAIPKVGFLDQAHGPEHSLEVHLPFLQKTLGPVPIVPLVAGDAPPEQVAAVLEALWGGPETLIVVSTDLSHFLEYEACRELDQATARCIAALDYGHIAPEGACGRVPVAGLLRLAAARSMSIRTLDVRNSGDTAGSKDRVVGYGAWALDEHPLRAYDKALVGLAKSAIAHRLDTATAFPLPTDGPDILRQPGAVFVTLKRQGQLRGCIGSVMAWRTLAEDIVDNAVKAALHDPRFSPVSPDEWPGLTLSVTVITPSEPMHFADQADFLRQLRPGQDGLRIEDQGRQALFIPSVWETLPTADAFVSQLKAKAGLPADHWSPSFKAWRFRAVELK